MLDTKQNHFPADPLTNRKMLHLFYGGPFSQWARTPFMIQGITYPTAEHWMMAQKARTFNDHEALAAIMDTTDPSRAKAIGRAVRNYDDLTWAQVRYSVVVHGSLAKFSQHTESRRYLGLTGLQWIVEASPTDRVWGIGLDETDERALDVNQWRGQNLLGDAIMEVRAAFRTMRQRS